MKDQKIKHKTEETLLESWLTVIGQVIAKERTKAGLSHEKMARKTGFDKADLVAIEQGADLTLDKLYSIAAALKLEPSHLMKCAERRLREKERRVSKVKKTRLMDLPYEPPPGFVPFSTLVAEDARVIENALYLLSARWMSGILICLARNIKRPVDLQKELPGLAGKTTIERLRELEKRELVTRKAFREVPPRVEYTLTESGHQVLILLEAIKPLGSKMPKD